MSDTAAWLVDRVLFRAARWRQYVITFPAPLAVGLCFRAELTTAVTNVCMRVLFEHQRGRAKTDAPGLPRPAAVVWLQRFSDGAGAWLHLHILAPDGVFRQLPRTLEVPFEPQPEPTPAEVRALVRRIADRVTRLLERRAATASDDALLERCATQPAKAIRRPTPLTGRARAPNPLRAEYQEFTLHAATSAPPNSPDPLERLCRYMGRPPIPSKRLRRLEDGRIEFTLKRPRRGVTKLVFEPVAFLARLAALIPRPGQNLIRYFGGLSAASPIRARILPLRHARCVPRPVQKRGQAPRLSLGLKQRSG